MDEENDVDKSFKPDDHYYCGFMQKCSKSLLRLRGAEVKKEF